MAVDMTNTMVVSPPKTTVTIDVNLADELRKIQGEMQASRGGTRVTMPDMLRALVALYRQMVSSNGEKNTP